MLQTLGRRPFITALLAAAALASVESAPARAQRLLVSSSGTNSVLAYDASTGAFLGVLVTNGSGGLNGPRQIRRGPDGRLYVVGLNNDAVFRYDYLSGAYVDTFVPGGSGGIHLPWAIATAPGGDLLATSATGPCVLDFHQTTGAYQSALVCDAGMGSMQGLIVDPNSGHAFISDFALGKIREYTQNGAFVRTYNGSPNFSPRGLAIGPNGNLFATSVFGNRIVQFDRGSGALIGDFVTSGSGGLSAPNDLAFRTNGNLLVSSAGNNSVLEYGPTGAFLRVLVPSGSGGLSGPCGIILENGRAGGGKPDLADYGDAPDDIPACEGTPNCSPTALYPTLYDTSSAATGRTAPFHLPLPAANDCWFGGPRTDEADAFQPCCDWVSAFHGGAPADQDDGPLVLCLDPGCLSGVIVLSDKLGRSAAIGCFGPMPPNPTNGFWIYRVGMGASADPSVNRYINVAVDWDLSGHFGDHALEWCVQDQPLAVAPGGTDVLLTPLFPILTVVPCGGPNGWCVGPFWTRFTVSPERMGDSFPNGDWDGSSGATDGYPWGETEDWVPYCDPQSSGGSCGQSGGFEDCNGNGRPDFVDVYFGYSNDYDANGIPDECQYNDSCSSPVSLCGFGPFPFDTAIASTGSEGQSNSLCIFYGIPGIADDVWYTWTAPESGTATVDTCDQTAVDTKIAVYLGSGCPTGSALACNDDWCNYQSQVSWSVVQGTTYTIQLGVYPGAYPGRGTFRLSLESGAVASICSPGINGVIACPCSNPPSGAGRGCNNSSSTGGAILAASGSPMLSADTLVFTTSGEKPTALSILLQGTSQISSGVVYGQGVRCAGGTLRRLYARAASGGSITVPQPGDPSVSARSAAMGNPISPGEHRIYAVYYRDPTVLGGCPATSTFNTTQSMNVTWGF